jgi:hypothetical protein
MHAGCAMRELTTILLCTDYDQECQGGFSSRRVAAKLTYATASASAASIVGNLNS